MKGVSVLRWCLLAAVLGCVAASGALQTFYIEPSREARLHSAAGIDRMQVCAVVLAVISLPAAALRLRWLAGACVAAGGAIALVAGQSDVSVLTYAVVPLSALALAAVAVVDLRSS